MKADFFSRAPAALIWHLKCSLGHSDFLKFLCSKVFIAAFCFLPFARGWPGSVYLPVYATQETKTQTCGP